MAELGLDRFPAFVEEVTGFTPFPWQRRLMATVLETGWPAVLDLPTGTGKTTALLIALYALAVAPERSARRIALVVDRRIIVDQVSDFAHRLKLALDDPDNPTCHDVAARLRELCTDPHASPVRLVHLRGGIPRDDTWLGTPDRPTLIASTVDQVGSRLLFRGYGVSESMRPVHAGVLARDTLYLLDEVHLATAFQQTLHHLEHTYRSGAEGSGTGRPFRVVAMSATPRPQPEDAPEAFHLHDEDYADPELAKRLGAPRPATLELVKTKQGNDPTTTAINRQRVADAAIRRVHEAIDGGARAVGVVLNRIDTARRIARLLDDHAPDLEVVLVTGRMRPFDKRDVQAALTRLAGTRSERPPGSPPAVIVATSCIEAGADLDFDALVTEVASLDALRQRFGRLNRLGNHPHARAWVLGRKDQLGSRSSPDPIYGDALRHTWDHLTTIAEDDAIDFGLTAFPSVDPERLVELLPPAVDAPVLFPSYLDMWSETRPAPHPDPDVSLWLHGKDRPPDRDVHVVFRADLQPVPPAPAPTHHELEHARARARAQVMEALEFLPPVAQEAVAVPLWELKQWRADHEGLWRWSADGAEWVKPSSLRPGDTVIVPTMGGGLSKATWDPTSTEPVTDIAELATLEAKRIAKLRIDPDTLPASIRSDVPTPPGDDDDPEAFERARTRCHEWLDGLADRLDASDAPWRPLVEALPRARAERDLVVARSGRGAPIWRVMSASRARAFEATTEDEVSVFTGAPVSLADHLADVEAWAAAFARTAGLAPDLAHDVALAGLLHDIGKADPRFQALLHGGDPIAAAGGAQLAKSVPLHDLAARRRATERSGWPAGLRHELLSLALLDASPELRAEARDLDLVRHLVASHHGWCRPWVPVVDDPHPVSIRVELAGTTLEVNSAAVDDALGIECASRFRRLCRRLGHHGVAYLEALLRLGDHRASATPRVHPPSP